jgi:hypothetical protein
VSDAGKRDSTADAERLLKDGYRVLAADVFYFGEARVIEKDWLFALLVLAVGDRPLGIQASQLAAVARWARERHGTAAEVVSRGPRLGLVALAAAGVEERAIGGLRLHGGPKSLKKVIEENRTVNEMPEAFCFGLLEAFDVKELAALASPRPVAFEK